MRLAIHMFDFRHAAIDKLGSLGIHWESVGGHRTALWPKFSQPNVDHLSEIVSPAARTHSAGIGSVVRRQEWLATRVLSMHLTGQEPSAGMLGCPIWLGGWQGSISHKNGHIAMWCSQHAMTYCGVDLEVCRELGVGVVTRIMNADERSLCGSSLIFAAKEAIYKALFPLVNKLFYFDAVALQDVTFAGDSYEMVFSVLAGLGMADLIGTRIRASGKRISFDIGVNSTGVHGAAHDPLDGALDYWLVVAYMPF